MWCQPPNHEDTQMLAEDYIRMGLTKASKYDDREPFMEETVKSILVIGGGMTGISAALGAAGARLRALDGVQGLIEYPDPFQDLS